MIAKLLLVALAMTSVASLATAEHELEPLEAPQSFCQGCRSLMGFASLYNSTQNRTLFKELTTEFCILQNPADHDEAYCDWFTETLFELLRLVDPVRHCDQLGACQPAAGSGSGANEIPAAGSADGIVCQVCEEAVMQMKTALTDPQVVTQIKQQTEAFCAYLTVIGEDKECRHLVDNYLDQAIDFMRNISPAMYCKSISLCTSATGSGRQLLQQQQPPQLPSTAASVLATFKGFGLENRVFVDNKLVKDINAGERRVIKGPNCVLCKTVIKEMFKFLKENRTEENIRQNLDKVCVLIFSKSPSKLKNCEEMVQTYSRQIIDMLIDETDPDLICTLLEQCTYRYINRSKRLPAPRPKRPATEPVAMSQLLTIMDSTISLNSKRTCLECKLFIEYLQGAVANAKTEEEVKDWVLDNLCNTFQSRSIKDACTSFVNTYSQLLFKAAIKELDPKAACIELKACSASRFQTLVIDNKPKVLSPINKSPRRTAGAAAATAVSQSSPAAKRLGSSFCDQCVDFVTQIDEYISSHPVDHDVDVLIDQVCNKIPSESAKNECVLFIKAFGQDIAQAISTMDSPRQLCSKLMLCAQ